MTDVRQTHPHAQEEETADHLAGGPGVVATKSQARGALGGIIVGAIVGAVMGFLIGAIAQGATLWIAPIVFAVGGAVAAGVFGGYFNSQQKRERTAADV